MSTIRTRALDNDHDWLFGKGQNDYLVDADAVNQNIVTRLLSFTGDCFFDIEANVDWFHLLGGKNEPALILAVKNTILNTKYVLTLQQLSVVLDRDRLETMSYLVTTVFHGAPRNSGGYLLTELGEILTTESGDRLGI